MRSRAVSSGDQAIGRVLRRATAKEIQHLHSVQAELERRCVEVCQQKVSYLYTWKHRERSGEKPTSGNSPLTRPMTLSPEAKVQPKAQLKTQLKAEKKIEASPSFPLRISGILFFLFFGACFAVYWGGGVQANNKICLPPPCILILFFYV